MCWITQKRFEGTRVTIETFLVWKAKFDSELAELRRQKGKNDTSNKKLTGTDHILTDTHSLFLLHKNCVHYTVRVKKTPTTFFVNNFAKCLSISKILLPLDSAHILQ